MKYQGSVRITNHLNGTQLKNYRRQLFTSRSLCIVMLNACYARIHHHMGTREAIDVLVGQRRDGRQVIGCRLWLCGDGINFNSIPAIIIPRAVLLQKTKSHEQILITYIYLHLPWVFIQLHNKKRPGRHS